MVKAKNTNGDLNFETKLWQAADKMRNNMDAAEYRIGVCPLFPKNIKNWQNKLE